MQQEIENKINEIKKSILQIKEHINYEKAEKQLVFLRKESQSQNLWNNKEYAEKILKEKNILEKEIGAINIIENELKDAIELIKMGIEEKDDAIITDSYQKIETLFKSSQKKHLETLLSGEADNNNCYLEINSGAGGTEAQDWTAMLSRMYQRWAERRNFKIEILQESNGEEAGLKSISMKFIGDKAYGWSKTESGVHRLVRISPFDSSSRRHTSFSSVWVYPEVDDKINIIIEDKELRIDTFRSSGAGGQHVNTTDSAIRITHIPSGIVVQCQNDRSQHRNRATAMNMLKARLYEVELQKKEKEAGSFENEKSDIGWGSQIRSYVLHPYQMVKDLRTNFETGNTQAVLDGDLDNFIENALSQKVGMKR